MIVSSYSGSISIIKLISSVDNITLSIPIIFDIWIMWSKYNLFTSSLDKLKSLVIKCLLQNIPTKPFTSFSALSWLSSKFLSLLHNTLELEWLA